MLAPASGRGTGPVEINGRYLGDMWRFVSAEAGLGIRVCIILAQGSGALTPADSMMDGLLAK